MLLDPRVKSYGTMFTSSSAALVPEDYVRLCIKSDHDISGKTQASQSTGFHRAVSPRDIFEAEMTKEFTSFYSIFYREHRGDHDAVLRAMCKPTPDVSLKPETQELITRIINNYYQLLKSTVDADLRSAPEKVDALMDSRSPEKLLALKNFTEHYATTKPALIESKAVYLAMLDEKIATFERTAKFK